MKKNEPVRILFSWLGESELISDIDKSGIARAMRARHFDEVHLLGNIDEEKEVTRGERSYGKVYTDAFFSKYKVRLDKLDKAKVFVHSCVLTSPTRFSEIFPFAQKIVKEVCERQTRPVEPVYHLSSGTAPMIAVWVLIAKTSYKGELIETRIPEHVRQKKRLSEYGVEPVEAPFEISAEFLPDLIKKTDASITARPIETPTFSEIIHRSPVMKEVVKLAHLAAQRDATVLLTGESGVGKELFARAIHAASLRQGKELLTCNCGAIPENLIESALFGHKKGSFTGADRDRRGLFLEAHQGSLFLDEVGELPLGMQTRLLRVLQEGEVNPVGSARPEKVDVRVIAATNRNLLEEIRRRNFREDLFYRLAVMVIPIPPLRERPEDISPIAEHLFKKLATRHGMLKKVLSPDAKNVLRHHHWPGNVRELENVLTRVLLWTTDDRVGADDLRRAICAMTGHAEPVETQERPIDGSWRLEDLLDEVARRYLKRALEQTHGKLNEAAELLGFNHYQTFKNWYKRLVED